MKCFLVARGEVVGWMEPEVFDKGMNVVSGPFHPNEKHEGIRSLIQQNCGAEEEDAVSGRELFAALDLHARTEEGERLEAGDGVHVTDFSQELEKDAMQLDVLWLTQQQFLRFWRDAQPNQT